MFADVALTLAGLEDQAESPLGEEYWERDGDLGPEYDMVVELFCFDKYLLPHLEWCQYTALSHLVLHLRSVKS